MMDIKTREVTRGSIKTIDRAAASMHHLKVDTIRSRSYDYGNSQESDNAGAYAENHIERTAGDSAAFASRAGIDLILNSRMQIRDTVSEANGYGAGMMPHTKESEEVLGNVDQIQRAFREQGVKTILERNNRIRLADEEVIRNTSEIKDLEISRKNALLKNDERIYQTITKKGGKRKKSAVLIPKSVKKDESVHRLWKQTAIRDIVSRKECRGFSRMMAVISGRPSGKAREALRTANLLRLSLKSAKALTTVLYSSATATVTVIILIVFFGMSFTMTGDSDGGDFAYDFYDIGAGDTAIVKVAESQLGNVGGDKYWKWYGFKSHVHWCACFVSWCADQCGYLKAGIIPRYSLVGSGANWFRERHRWASGGYTPKPGDIIFFDYGRDGELDHTGIVESCDGKTLTTIEGNSRNACRRLSYVIGSSQIAGYGVPGYNSGMTSDKACSWAAMIADDDSYHYVYWVDGDSKTHECPVCNEHPKGKYRGWNCIGFSFACWKHGAGIKCRCSCNVIDNGSWERLLNCKTDAEANRLASKMVGVPCMVIRNEGKAIPVKWLKKGDILSLFSGSTYFHTMFYEGKGKYADSTCGRSDEIQSGLTMSEGTKSQVKVAIRYIG